MTKDPETMPASKFSVRLVLDARGPTIVLWDAGTIVAANRQAAITEAKATMPPAARREYEAHPEARWSVADTGPVWSVDR